MAKASAGARSKKKTAAAHGGVNKAQAIRDAAEQLGKKVRPRDVIRALAAAGITVSPPQVSVTLKAAGYRRARRAKRTAKPAANHQSKATEVSLAHLLAAKALAAKLGSVEAARNAIDILAKLA
jgi:hypothetical protein